jgi:DNA polymerase III, delta subunit
MNNHDQIRSKLDYFIRTKKIPNIIFHGPTHSGKRTILNEFLQKIYENDTTKMKSNIMTVECCHGKGIKFIREDLKFFAKAHIQSNHGTNFKSIVLLNADSLTIDAQSALRRCIELFSHNTRFFIIVENKERLLNPILSRFCEIYVSPRCMHFTQHHREEIATKETYQKIRNIFNPSLGASFIDAAVSWCNLGYSAKDWMDCYMTYETVEPTRFILVSMCFNKMKPYFRCEQFLTYYVMHLLYYDSQIEETPICLCSNPDLENMLL